MKKVVLAVMNRSGAPKNNRAQEYSICTVDSVLCQVLCTLCDGQWHAVSFFQEISQGPQARDCVDKIRKYLAVGGKISFGCSTG